MDFDLNSDQMLLKDGLERLLADLYTFEQRKRYSESVDGFSRELWRQYADMGILGLPYPEEYGGFGGGPVENMVVMNIFGKFLILEPYLATVILFGGGILRAGSEAQKRAYLPEIVQGKLLGALAHYERDSRYDLAHVTTTARETDAGWVLDGEKIVVQHGDCADRLLVSARVEGDRRDKQGIALFIVDARAPGIGLTTYKTQDSLTAADIAFRGVRVDADGLLGGTLDGYATIEQLIHSGIQCLVAEAVGGMQEMLDTTVEYLKLREQFGVPIGRFQALQHRAVDMLIATEQARSMAMFAAMMVDENDASERAKALSAAKIEVGRSSRYVGQQAIQLHGGIGMTLAYKVGHYFIRATMTEMTFGDTDHHLAELARAGGLVAPAAELIDLEEQEAGAQANV